jgi:hypothetical protein
MGAVYRFAQGWDFDKIYQEMLNYDFYTSNGHQKALDFVKDYSNKMVAMHNAAAATTAVVGNK